MKISTFIANFREAFGEAVALPLVFWYSDIPVANGTEKINGCFFHELEKLQKGEALSLNAEVLGCVGGQLYTGFSGMSERTPRFVSLKEKYKKTPEMVVDFVQNMGIPLTDKRFLNVTRIDQIGSFEGILGLIFFAAPDVLSGLTTWAFFDNNADDAVTAKFGSGCSSIFTEAVVENLKNGRRTFLGLFDPSVRHYVASDMLSFAIPMSRFKEMYHTMRECSLFDTPAWGRVRNRINAEEE